MLKPTLSDLPDEIIQCILIWVIPVSTAAFGQTSRRFRFISNTPSLWRLYCVQHFKHWDQRHRIWEKFRFPASMVDWKELYSTRHLTDLTVTDILESILACQTGRIEKFNRIIHFGYDAKDALLRHSAAAVNSEDYLARRNAILGCLHRTIAIRQWNDLRIGKHVSLECALGAFDMFVLKTSRGDLDDISQKLGEIVSLILTECPSIVDFSPRERALRIAQYLRENNLTGIDPGSDFYNLEHNFLGLALRDERHNSLPLISAAIYCYVARKFDLNAQPCGFPFHVHVLIEPEYGYDMDGWRVEGGTQGPPMYMDPFRSVRETPVSELQSQLNYLGTLSLPQSTFLRESLTGEIVLRCGKNILNSIKQSTMSTVILLDITSAAYAAIWSSILCANYSALESSPEELGSRVPIAQFRRYLPSLLEYFATNFPFDVYLVEQYLVPLFYGFPEYDHLKESVYVMKAGDQIPKQIKRRTAEYSNVKYRVGQVFRHRRYGYVAVIAGWDPECGAAEHWMQQMGIDRLQAGRVEDASVRYVAEENILLIQPQISEIPGSFLEFLGKHFKRWDSIAHCFVSNIQDEYPDD
ncbi:hypothetical protein LOZ66_006915 [Ophidiomyces ophidiicola]|nr:hypothetical protein LOZ66_006915 [Ophidiomyces ophidiicola]